MNRGRLVILLNITKGLVVVTTVKKTSNCSYLILLLLFSFLFSSCLKDDEPVAPHQPGNSIITSFDFGTNYRYQGFFDLATNTFVAQNLKSTWDLAFDTRQGKFNVVLNGAKFCKVANMGNVNFDSVTDTTGSKWTFDTNTGNLDSTGIGQWYSSITTDTLISKNETYILDRGYDESNLQLGYKKFKIYGTPSGYYLFFSSLGGTDAHWFYIPKNASANLFAYVSLTGSGSVVSAEPPTNTYDIVFTQYIYVYRTVEYFNFPYLVTGVVLNRDNIVAAADSINPYESITLADTANLQFTNRLDIIGYDWKDYNFDLAKFSVKPYKNYIIRNRNGLYYKFRFLDFYKDGIKGNVLFEYQLL